MVSLVLPQLLDDRPRKIAERLDTSEDISLLPRTVLTFGNGRHFLWFKEKYGLPTLQAWDMSLAPMWSNVGPNAIYWMIL